jgi:PAS domain-containing protein
MDAVNDVILIFDPKSFRILDANKRAVEAYGYSHRELVRKEMLDLNPRWRQLFRSNTRRRNY